MDYLEKALLYGKVYILLILRLSWLVKIKVFFFDFSLDKGGLGELNSLLS